MQSEQLTASLNKPRVIQKLLGIIIILICNIVTEMSTRNIKIIMFLGSKVRLVPRADKLIANYEPIF
jgi:hypothetical protein